MPSPNPIEEPYYDPREDGFSEAQALEIEAAAEGSRKFFRELANGEWDQDED